MRVVVQMVLLALLAASPPFAARAQSYPAKPISIVVPYTPGGPADVLVRALGQKLTESWGQPVIVENRSGANEIIAAQTVAKSAPDGYTLLLASDAVFSLNPYLYSKIPYDPVKDFAPVTKVVTANMMLVARPDFPAANLTELIAYIKAHPGKVNYGSVGNGGVNHLAMSWVGTLHGLKMNHVPYKGLVQALTDMSASTIDLSFAVIGGAMPFVTAGKLKAYAVSGRTRNALAAGVPTFAEAGYPDLDASFYFGMAAPSGTPSDIIGKVAAEVGRIINTAEFRQKHLAMLGFEPVGDTPGQFTAFLETDRALAAKKVQGAGVKLD